MEPEATSTELAKQRTDLAFDRTVMAVERTLMAWGRTGLSQIGLGLSLYKFLEAMKVHTGFRLALVIIAAGTMGSLLGIVDYVSTIKRLNRDYGHAVSAFQFQIAVAAMITLFGLIVLVTLLVGYELG